MAGGPDEGGAGDGAGTSRPVARTGAAWNGHDDAAVHGIFAAAKAAAAAAQAFSKASIAEPGGRGPIPPSSWLPSAVPALKATVKATAFRIILIFRLVTETQEY